MVVDDKLGEANRSQLTRIIRGGVGWRSAENRRMGRVVAAVQAACLMARQVSEFVQKGLFAEAARPAGIGCGNRVWIHGRMEQEQ